jgi:hypothetical protein
MAQYLKKDHRHYLWQLKDNTDKENYRLKRCIIIYISLLLNPNWNPNSQCGSRSGNRAHKTGISDWFPEDSADEGQALSNEQVHKQLGVFEH